MAGPQLCRVVVLCANSEGAPEFYLCSLAASAEERHDGRHYEQAIAEAREHGYVAPMIAFDHTDPAGRQLVALSIQLNG